jgi:predicted RNA-binding protein with TRAM domain
VISEASAAIDLERKLRALARGSRVQAYRVEVNARVAALLIGPGASRLEEIEAASRRRFFLEAKEDVHLDHFLVLEQGKLESIAPEAPFEEGATLDVQPVEVGLHDPHAGVAKLDGHPIVVADAAKLVGKKVKARVTRVLPGTAYATLVKTAKDGAGPITAEGEAEKPTRTPSVKKETTGTAATDSAAGDEQAAPKKKTRRGSRGGRRRKKAPTIHVPEAQLGENGSQPEAEPDPAEAVTAGAPPAENDAEAAQATAGPKKRKTRRGSRGGRNRRKKPAAAAPAETTESS